MDSVLSGLNQQQRQAVTATEGYIRVLAGAGSGKTRALAHRFACLAGEIGIPPGNILCVTFTNKSAAEMRQRIRVLTGGADTGYISTFHSFCVTVLQEDIHAVQYPKNFLVLDNSDIDSMLGVIYEERGLTLRHMTFAKARDMIEIRKLDKDPTYYEHMIAFSLSQLQQKYLDSVETDDIIFWGYLYQQKKCFGLDYNDLIKYTLHIFAQNDAIRLKWQQRLQYIMVDEYQDIDELQYTLMKVLCAHHGNLFIVGDPDQTIYTWRGASVKYILDFEKVFPNVQTIMMMQNYRSTPQILAAANSLIEKNKARVKKELIPTLPAGETVLFHHAKTTEDEAAWIAQQISVLADRGVPLGDVTVLYRAHYITRTIEEVFLKKDIPYTIYSGVQFFGRKEIKDALSYLRLIAYGDDLSLARVINVPRRNIGEKRMQFLTNFAEQNHCSLMQALRRSADHDIFKNTKMSKFLDLIDEFSASHHGRPVSELLAAVLDKSGYEAMLRTEGSQERLDNLAELKQSVYEYEASCGEEVALEDYLRRVALLTNADAGAAANAVKLMTVHTAKGLEFPYVFLCRMNEGAFPAKKTATAQAMEEERRLAFVAFTRAEKRLYLTDAEGRNFDGGFRYPSRFLFDVEKKLLEYTTELPESLVSEARWHITSSQRTLEAMADQKRFEVGDRVVHSIMGPGQIVGIDKDKSAYIVKFDGLDTTRSLSFLAKLIAE